MNIIWTNWKVALWRHRYTRLLTFICFFALIQSAVYRPSPVDPEIGLTILYDILYWALYLFLLCSGYFMRF